MPALAALENATSEMAEFRYVGGRVHWRLAFWGMILIAVRCCRAPSSPKAVRRQIPLVSSECSRTAMMPTLPTEILELKVGISHKYFEK
jgi:hypothetical protein